MLTGDSRTTAETVAKSLASMMSRRKCCRNRKAEAVKRLQAKGGRSRWRGTASTTRPRWRRPTSGLPWGPGPMLRWRALPSRLIKGDLRGIVARPAFERSDDAEHPAEPLLRLHLQRPRRADRRWRAVSVFRPAAEPDDRQRRDDVQFGVGHRKCAAAPANRTMKAESSEVQNHTPLRPPHSHRSWAAVRR